MTLRGYLLGLQVSTLLAFLGWASAVLFVDPDASGIIGRALFFVTFFLWTTGLLAFLSTRLSYAFAGEDRTVALLGVLARRSILVSVLFFSGVLLQYFGFFAVWNMALIAVGLLLIELRSIRFDQESYIATRKDHHQSRGEIASSEKVAFPEQYAKAHPMQVHTKEVSPTQTSRLKRRRV